MVDTLKDPPSSTPLTALLLRSDETTSKTIVNYQLKY